MNAFNLIIKHCPYLSIESKYKSPFNRYPICRFPDQDPSHRSHTPLSIDKWHGIFSKFFGDPFQSHYPHKYGSSSPSVTFSVLPLHTESNPTSTNSFVTKIKTLQITINVFLDTSSEQHSRNVFNLSPFAAAAL